MLGRFPSGMDGAVGRLADLIGEAGSGLKRPWDQERSRSKTLYNSALNRRYSRCPYGALTDPHAWAIVTAIVRAYRVVEVRVALLGDSGRIPRDPRPLLPGDGRPPLVDAPDSPWVGGPRSIF